MEWCSDSSEHVSEVQEEGTCRSVMATTYDAWYSVRCASEPATGIEGDAYQNCMWVSAVLDRRLDHAVCDKLNRNIRDIPP